MVLEMSILLGWVEVKDEKFATNIEQSNVKVRNIDLKVDLDWSKRPIYNIQNIDKLEKEMIEFTQVFGSKVSQTKTLMDIN